MAKGKRVTATVKLTYHEDGDLIGWWHSIPKGTRSAVMKDMMREYMVRNGGSFRPVLPRNVPQPFDPQRFVQVCEDAAWIRTALHALPGQMERLAQQVARVGVVSGGEVVGDAEADKREARMKKAQW